MSESINFGGVWASFRRWTNRWTDKLCLVSEKRLYLCSQEDLKVQIFIKASLGDITKQGGHTTHHKRMASNLSHSRSDSRVSRKIGDHNANKDQPLRLQYLQKDSLFRTRESGHFVIVDWSDRFKEPQTRFFWKICNGAFSDIHDSVKNLNEGLRDTTVVVFESIPNIHFLQYRK